MLVLKKKIKEYLRKVGYSLYKSSSFVSPSSEQVTKTIINRNDKVIIFDVGAYIGNSAKKYSEWFPQSLIYSFEPFEPNFNELAKLSLRY